MSSQLEVVERSRVDSQEWDQFVDESPEAWLWHTFDIQEALDVWHDRGDASLAVRAAKDGPLVAVLPLQLKQLGPRWLVGARSLESLGGPAFRTGLSRGERRRVWDAVQSHIEQLLRRSGGSAITVTLSPLAPAYRGEDCPRVSPLQPVGYVGVTSQTWITDLRCEEETLWQRLEGRARTSVRKAEKAGTAVRQAGASHDDLLAYYRLHCQTYERTGAKPHPLEYFSNIWDRFLTDGRALVYFAEHDGEVVAAQSFGRYKRGAVYWTGAASDTGLATGANSLVQWRAMCDLRRMGVEWYEAGEAFPMARDQKSRGLSDFKRSFGGELYPIHRVMQLWRKLSLHSMVYLYKRYLR